ncbi:hypothetical protein PMF13cell1_02601 [Blautia producta]|uniref:Uncharacterized protein n=2 Tax=Blautia producta TaxID=33035 RepID=A0A4P6LYR5_9FIRM|nr:hypothetical protein PMF13cell1_02601 [Blautia producta]
MDYDGDFRVNLYRKELLTDGNPLELTTSAGNVSESAGTVQKNAGNTSKSAGTVPENAGNASESAGTVPENAGNASESAGTVPESAGSVSESARRVPEHSEKISSNAGKQLFKLYAKEQHRIIMDHIKINGYITSSQTETLLHIKQRRARDILSRMTREGLLERRGSGKNTVYYPAS